ncbi:hypothetical protein DIPPA_25053 [Diplonema papillatum]|nr:hypothetical protein DIPPA_25053 [Diplonema papillatum]
MHAADPLDSIEEWLALKRQTTRALGPPPEPLDVDQWFKAGQFSTNNVCPPGTFPTPAGQAGDFSNAACPPGTMAMPMGGGGMGGGGYCNPPANYGY